MNSILGNIYLRSDGKSNPKSDVHICREKKRSSGISSLISPKKIDYLRISESSALSTSMMILVEDLPTTAMMT